MGKTTLGVVAVVGAVVTLLISSMVVAQSHSGRVLSVNAEEPITQDNVDDFYLGLGNFLAESHPDLALRFLGHAADSDDPTVRLKAMHNAGVVEYWEGNLGQAEVHFEAALAEDDSYDLAHYHLAILLHEGGRFTESVDHFRTHVENQPQSSQAHFDFGVAIANAVRYQGAEPTLLFEARDSFATTLAIDSNYPHAQNNLEIIEGFFV